MWKISGMSNVKMLCCIVKNIHTKQSLAQFNHYKDELLICFPETVPVRIDQLTQTMKTAKTNLLHWGYVFCMRFNNYHIIDGLWKRKKRIIKNKSEDKHVLAITIILINSKYWTHDYILLFQASNCCWWAILLNLLLVLLYFLAQYIYIVLKIISETEKVF